MKVRRGARLPKRLIEVTFGSVVGEVLPDAVLWASTYRPTDGVGIRPRDIGERRELELWAIAAADLQEFTEDRMRGTVDRRDLEHLAAAGYARPLRELLTPFRPKRGQP